MSRKQQHGPDGLRNGWTEVVQRAKTAEGAHER